MLLVDLFDIFYSVHLGYYKSSVFNFPLQVYICLLKFVLFADDTNIFCSNENVEVLQDTLNRKLANLFVWFSINNLSLNLGKTNYIMLF